MSPGQVKVCVSAHRFSYDTTRLHRREGPYAAEALSVPSTCHTLLLLFLSWIEKDLLLPSNYSGPICIVIYIIHNIYIVKAVNISLFLVGRDIRPNSGFLTQIAELDLQLFRERLERIRLEPSSSSSSESEPESPPLIQRRQSEDGGQDRRLSVSSQASSISVSSSVSSSVVSSSCSTKNVKLEEDAKDSSNKRVSSSPKSSDDNEYHSAVSSVRSSSLSSNCHYENAVSRSVSISVQLSLSRTKDSNECSQYVSRCIRIQSDDSSLESENDADDESSDNEGWISSHFLLLMLSLFSFIPSLNSWISQGDLVNIISFSL